MRVLLTLAVAVFVFGATSSRSNGQTFGSDFSGGNYSFVTAGFGTPPGVPAGPPGGLGGLVVRPDDLTKLLVVGNANSGSSAIYEIGVTRDPGTLRITGFSGTATPVLALPNLDSGLSFAANGTLFAVTNNNEVLQFAGGNLAATPRTDTLSLGGGFTGTLTVVPDYAPGAGGLRVATVTTSDLFNVGLAPSSPPASPGTFDLSTTAPPRVADFTATTGQESSPLGIAYVTPGSLGFTAPAVIVSEFSAGKLAAYELDASGNPVLSSRREFLTGLTGAAGLYLDPFSGDLLVSTFGGGDRIVVVRGFAPVPEPLGVGAVAAAAVGGWWVRRRRRAAAC